MPAVDRHLRFHAVLGEQRADDRLGLVDRLRGVCVRVDRVPLAANGDGAAEAVPHGIVGLVLPELLE